MNNYYFTSIHQMTQSCIVFCTVFLLSTSAFGQVNINGLETVIESFTGFTGTAEPTNWKITNGAGPTNWRGTTIDRQLGWYGDDFISYCGNNGNPTSNATWILKNNSGQPITAFTVGIKAQNFLSQTGTTTGQMSWSTSASITNPTGDVLTLIPGLNFSDATLDITSGVTLIQSVTGQNIPNGHYIFIRFTNSGSGNNQDNMGIDNVVFAVNALLSVELTDFGIEQANKTNVLTWKTADQKDLNRFIVERSANGKDYTELAEIKSAGSDDSEYEYMDNTPLPILSGSAISISYYRLHILENDGQSSYSKVLTAITSNSSKSVKIYPNPVGTDGYINVLSEETLDDISIVNTLGQVVLRSNTSLRIDVSQLPRGLYHLTAKNNGEWVTQKFLK